MIIYPYFKKSNFVEKGREKIYQNIKKLSLGGGNMRDFVFCFLFVCFTFFTFPKFSKVSI